MGIVSLSYLQETATYFDKLIFQNLAPLRSRSQLTFYSCKINSVI